MASIIKDIGEIWSRLFDHRPFIQGEISFFLREFQDKRGDREVERLLKILEYSTELKGNQHDRTQELADCHLPTLKTHVDVTLSMCEKILQREQEFEEQFDKLAQEKAAIKQLEWEQNVDYTNKDHEKVDQTFGKKENEIREHNIGREKELHTTP